MSEISNSIYRFTEAVQRGESVYFEKSGKWSCEGRVTRFVRRLFGWETSRLEKVAEVFISQLDAIERNTRAKTDGYINGGEVVLNSLSSCNSKKAQELKRTLKQRIVALKYRGNSGACDTAKQKTLEGLARAWKEKQPLFEEKEKELNPLDRAKIEAASHYPAFVELLESDKGLREDFFKWAIRDNNNVDLFVKFPTVYKRLKTSYLSGRIGRFATDILQVEGRDVTMLFEGKKVSILNEKKKVAFKGDYSLSIKEIFDTFQRKNHEIGKLEMFCDGVRNWNSHELGYWNAKANKYQRISYDKKEWWKDLPVFEKVTQEELEGRLGSKVNPDDWGVVMAKSSRELKQLDVDKSHGYLGLAIKNEEGTYTLYNMGKFAAKFPSSMLGYLTFLADTVRSKIEYPDTNEFYSHRQIAVYSRGLSQQQGERLMGLIAEDLKRARQGNLVFQFGWENCAYWPQEMMKKIFPTDTPNLYRVSTLQVEPTNSLLKRVVRWINDRTGEWKKRFLRLLIRILGSWRGICVVEGGKYTFKSLADSPYEDHYEMYNPGFAHKQIEKGTLPGVLHSGHTNLLTMKLQSS